MSSSRVEYAIVGVFVDKLPFEDDEEHMPYTCHMDNEPIWAVRLYSCDEDEPGFVIGRVLSKASSECACSVLSEIKIPVPRDDLRELKYLTFLDLKNKLKMDIDAKDVKLYRNTN